jgi:hypothetical protein
MTRVWIRTVLLSASAAFAAVSTAAAPLSIRTLDASGAPIEKALVMVQFLEPRQEMLRALSNLAGEVPGLELKPGLYRVVAAYPRGVWRTVAREFMVSSERVELVLKMSPFGTCSPVVVPPVRTTVTVLDAAGVPVSDVDVLFRDADAKREAWRRTDSSGRANVDLGLFTPEICDPLEWCEQERGDVVVVVVRDNAVLESRVPSAEAEKLRRKGGDTIVRLP